MDRVEVKDPASQRVYVFPCEKWLSKTKEDGEVARDLYPLVDADEERRASRENSRSRRELDADKRPREDERGDLREKFGFRNDRDRDRQFR